VRAITKSRAGHRQSLMDVSVDSEESRSFEECPNVGDLVK